MKYATKLLINSSSSIKKNSAMRGEGIPLKKHNSKMVENIKLGFKM